MLLIVTSMRLDYYDLLTILPLEYQPILANSVALLSASVTATSLRNPLTDRSQEQLDAFKPTLNGNAI